MSSRDFEIRIVGDSSKAVKAVEGFGSKMRSVFGRSEKDASAFKGVFSGAFLGTAFAGVLAQASAAVGDFIGGSIGQASDLHETMSASEVIFGKNAAAISKWGDSAAKNLGLSKQKAVDAATSFGDMLLQLGFTGDQAVKSSTGIVQMAADLGSFKNLETGEVLDMIAGAMRGEFDSLQRVIPNINAARVEHEALTETGKKNAKQLTAQEKAQATLAIIQKDGARAAGDFARTSGGAANQSKILKAQMEDQQAVLGAKLLPIWTQMQSFLINQVIPTITAIVDWMEKNSDTVKILSIVLGILIAAIIAVNVVMWILSINPIVLSIMAILLAVVALIGFIVLLVTHWDQVVIFVRGVWGAFVKWIVAGMMAFGNWWSGIWAAIGNYFSNFWTGIATFFSNLWTQWIPAPIRNTLAWMGAFIRTSLAVVSRIWSTVWGAIGSFVSKVWNNWIVAPIRKAWNWVQTVIRIGLTAIGKVWSDTWNGLVGIVKGIWNGVLGWIEGGINGAIDLINNLIRGINTVAGVVGIHVALIPHVSLPRLAAGTVTNGPMVALIGDNPGGREVVQPVSTYQDELRRAYTAGQQSTGAGGAVTVELVDRTTGGLMQLIDVRVKAADRDRVRISKMGKQAHA